MKADIIEWMTLRRMPFIDRSRIGIAWTQQHAASSSDGTTSSSIDLKFEANSVRLQIYPETVRAFNQFND